MTGMYDYRPFADLVLEFEGFKLLPLEQEIPGGITRLTTIVQLEGKGHIGQGEDVTYDSNNQISFQQNGLNLFPSGKYRLDEFSKIIEQTELFADKPSQNSYINYRRWAFESAAMSLALKQNDISIDEILGLKRHPLTFVVSTRLNTPATLEPIKSKLAIYPGLKFKLDPTEDWSNELIEKLSELGVVDVLDLKGHYKGTPVDVETDPTLYEKVIKYFPDAIIEDADINESTNFILHSARDRLSWDAPVHSVSDILRLPRVKYMNIKPSRIGSFSKLFEIYNYCHQHDIQMYGGGQFELGIGRNQIQLLASLFHPDGPNDVAPVGYNQVNVDRGLPDSPMQVKVNF